MTGKKTLLIYALIFYLPFALLYSQDWHCEIPVFLKEIKDVPPDPINDFEWQTCSGTAVEQIEHAYNEARKNENSELNLSIPMMNLPSQTEWDAMSDNEKTFWLVNCERKDRGVMELEGINPYVVETAQAYAQLLLETNTFGHFQPSGDGSIDNPWKRLEEHPVIGEYLDFLNVVENLTVFRGGWTFTTARAVYTCMYQDKGVNWGHRHCILYYPYDDNYGETGKEGFLGVGKVTGTHQGYDNSDIVVFNVCDPSSDYVVKIKDFSNRLIKRDSFTLKVDNKMINIQLDDKFDGDIKIYNIHGQQIIHQKISSDHLTIRLNKITTGLLIITLDIGNKQFVKRVLVR